MKKMFAGIRSGMTVAAATVPALAFAGALAGQVEGRMGWQPYLGCWERPQPMVEAETIETAAASEGVLCFVAGDAGVEMLTVADGAVTHREPFPADGQPRTIEQDGCRGTETARFSDDRRRIYTASRIVCEDGATRRGTGIISMPSPAAWLDVRAMEVDGEATAWSQWYQRTSSNALAELGIETGEAATPLALRGAASYAAAPITIEHVVDASRNVDAKAVAAWIAESGQPFARLDSDDLLRLDAAGVPGQVIDVVVAVSFPHRFALNRQGAYPEDAATGVRPARTIMMTPGYYDPLWGGYGYNPYYSRYGYNRYGYGYGGYYGGYGWGGGYYRPVVVEVTHVEPERGGRWVAGKGYQGSRPTANSGPSRTVGGGAIQSTGGTRSTGAATGGSRSTGGRKAKPKGGKG